MSQVKASVAIQILPYTNGGTDEVIRVVDAVIDYIRSTGLNYYVGPCETAVEGDFDMLVDIIKNCHIIAIKEGCNMVSSYVKINYAPDSEVLAIAKKINKYQR